MKFALAALLGVSASLLCAAEKLTVFGDLWDVPSAADWSIVSEGGMPVLHMVAARGPLPGPRRPIQFALMEMAPAKKVKVEVNIRPLQKSCILVFHYRDAAHFDYAHLSTDTGTKQPVHNGIFHVFGGERVRISSQQGPPAFPASNRWYHVQLSADGDTGEVTVAVDGQKVPALHAVDLSLTEGRIGLGSFDELGEFKNLKVVQ